MDAGRVNGEKRDFNFVGDELAVLDLFGGRGRFATDFGIDGVAIDGGELEVNSASVFVTRAFLRLQL